MPWWFVAFAVAFIVLHGPDGQVIYVSPDHITNYRQPRGVDQGHFTGNTRCLVFTVDGKYFTTAESCEEIGKRLRGLAGE